MVTNIRAASLLNEIGRRTAVCRIARGRAMRRLLTALCLCLPLAASTAAAQTVTFDREGVEYILELPSSAWRPVPRLDVHEHFEFVRGGDRADGYLRLRKCLVDAGTTPADLFSRDVEWGLRSLPGFIVCGECQSEKFDGRLSGMAFSYEYTSGGRPMAGRIYYLRVDDRTFYTLHFTFALDELRALREQMDSISRSFRLR